MLMRLLVLVRLLLVLLLVLEGPRHGRPRGH
jgi:hypothetical protein